MRLFAKMLLPLLIVFSASLIFIFLASSLWAKHQIDVRVLLFADVFFLLVSVIVYFIQAKALSHANPNVFIRSITIGMMIKMFGTAAAVIIYALVAGNRFDTKAVFISLFLYLLYLAAEVKAISAINRGNNA